MEPIYWAVVVVVVFLFVSVNLPEVVDDYKRKACPRKGHPTKRRRQYYWYDPYECRVILRRVRVDVDKCYCGKKREETMVDTDDYQSVSWPQSYWDELRDKGRLWNKG